MVKCTLLDRYGCVVATPSPLYLLQDEPSDNVVAAINLFTNSRDPPLQPALGRKGMHTHTHTSVPQQQQQWHSLLLLSIEHIALQLSISAEPPEYDEANRHLQV